MIKHADLSALGAYLYHGSPESEGRPAFGDEANTTIRIEDGDPFFVTEDLGYAAYFARGGLVASFRHAFAQVADLFDEDTLLKSTGDL